MIEGSAINQVVAERYRKTYVLRFGLLRLMGVVPFFMLSYASAALAARMNLAWDPPATGTVDGPPSTAWLGKATITPQRCRTRLGQWRQSPLLMRHHSLVTLAGGLNWRCTLVPHTVLARVRFPG